VSSFLALPRLRSLLNEIPRRFPARLIHFFPRNRRPLQVFRNALDALRRVQRVHFAKLGRNIRTKTQKERNIRPVRLPYNLVANAQRNGNVPPDVFVEVRKLLLEILDTAGAVWN